MWTSKNRSRYDRSKLRYPSDLTDDEWKLVEPLIPPGKPGGGKRTVIMREVVNGLMYILSTGCQWRAIPKDLPPKSSVYDYFDLWTYDGTLERIHHALYEQCREQVIARPAASGPRPRSSQRQRRARSLFRQGAAVFDLATDRSRFASDRQYCRPPNHSRRDQSAAAAAARRDVAALAGGTRRRGDVQQYDSHCAVGGE